MRAWVVDGGFGLDRLAQVTVDRPEPGPGQVVVRVHAVSLNYRDLLMVTGAYDPRQRLPLVPCSDAVGEVTAVGPGVRDVKVGERVCPIFAQAWIAGQVEGRMTGTTLGGPLQGTLSEYVVVSAEGVVRAPSHLSDVAAATLPCAAVTAWRALVTEGGVTAGSTVLTLGTGGVSLFVVQLGAMLGARVMVTSSSGDKLARALALGAVQGVNYVEDPSWGKAAAAWTAGRGVDLVVELGGAGTLDQSLRAVRPGGIVALVGNLDGVDARVMLPRIFMRGLRLQGILVGSRADFEALVRALEAHPEVHPVVDQVFGFDEAPAAFEALRSRSHFGKVVVQVAT